MKMVQRIKKSKLGRVICRLLGEERGAIMMEYVIVAVLIAAAAVAAVAYFGKDIVAMFNVAGTAATGNAQQAGKDRVTARDDRQTKYSNSAIGSNGKFSDVGDSNQTQGSNPSGGGGNP